MNWNTLIFLAVTLVSVYQLMLYAVQYRSANNPTPDNVKDVYDAETYARWKKYSAEKSRLQIFNTLLSWGLTMLLLALKAHAAVAGLFPANAYVQLIAVLVFQALVETLVGTVTAYADTMVIEQKYGFNRSTMKTFVMDCVRNFLMETVISVVLMSVLAALHMALGDWMILLFAGVVFVISLLISFLYPILSRMGNKFTPLEEGELRDKLTALLTSHGYKVKAIEVMDASRRTTKSNAYFTGFGAMKTIVLFDNLIASMTSDEICAVFAHELGHGLHKDVPKMQIMNLGNMLIMALMAWLVVKEPALHRAFGFAEINYGFAYILLGCAALALTQPVTSILMGAYSRFAEYRADRQAVKEGYGQALTSALKKLARDNFSHLSPSRLQVVLDYSHPPLSQRVAAVEKAMRDNACNP